ncbi:MULTISPECIES: hypothetical protein [Synechococcales]|uniref:hypothetical protein n=1 Tax=Synechococcus sp. CS-1333 TaxID=2848638 RepID=UPI00223BD879|nr:hypothetical protein [Synechococcus sp. CS-1333]MCT0210199.1 hypothetical protein [Synechococcus sp. CS-1333]
METHEGAEDQSFHIEMVRQLNLLPNKFHQISDEDIDHLNEISIKEAERQLSLTSAAMKLFSNFEKLLPNGPIAAKKLGGFASTPNAQSK